MQLDFENYSISPIHEKDAWRLCDLIGFKFRKI